MRVLALSLLLLIGAVCAPVSGQSSLEDKQKAVVVFDIQLDKIRNSSLAKSLKLEDQMKAMQQPGNPNLVNLERIFGAVSAPENMEAAASIQAGQLPVEFFVRIKFSSTDEVDKMIAKAEKDNSGVIERNGKKYYKAPAQSGMPGGVILYAVDEMTLEMGTEAYIFRSSDNAKPFTDGLNDAWGKVPGEDAVRIAIDLEGAKGLISEVVAMGQQTSPPPVGEYLNLIDNMKNLRISFDVSGENLLTIQSTGVGSEEAEELKSGLDSLLAMGAMAGKSQLPQIEQMDPEGAAVLSEIIEALKATQEGAEVSIIIPKPSGFDAAIEKAAKMLPGLMGGGMGGPPRGPGGGN